MHPGTECPRCGDYDSQEWLSTTNEWENYCPKCDVRYNDAGDIRPVEESVEPDAGS